MPPRRPGPGRLPLVCGAACRRRADTDRNGRKYSVLKRCGACTKCGAAAPGGKSLCPACAARNNAAIRAARSRRREAGLCTICGAPAPGGKSRCDACAAKRRTNAFTES